MTQISQPDTAQIAARYLAVWSEPDPVSRDAAIAGLWAPGGAEFVEGTQFRGHEELDGRITAAYQEFVGSGWGFPIRTDATKLTGRAGRLTAS